MLQQSTFVLYMYSTVEYITHSSASCQTLTHIVPDWASTLYSLQYSAVTVQVALTGVCTQWALSTRVHVPFAPQRIERPTSHARHDWETGYFNKMASKTCKRSDFAALLAHISQFLLPIARTPIRTKNMFWFLDECLVTKSIMIKYS